jgi:predicted aspartyl protease
MMTGKIEEGVYPRVLIPAVTSTGNIFEKMLVDTGFDGEVTIHYNDADRFDLELEDCLKIEYASGDSIDEIYGYGKILWFGEIREVEVILSNDEEPALGTRLLKSCVMNMNFIDDTLTIDKPLR